MNAAWDNHPYTGSRIAATLQAAEQIVRTWGMSQLMRKMAADIRSQYRASIPLEEARAVQIWIHNRVNYRRDPQDAELIQDPVTTLNNGGDCDDQAILAASLLRAIGHDAYVATVQWQGRTDPSHAVCLDLTANCVVDPVSSVWPEQWPPEPFKVLRMTYLNKTGETVSLDGLFSKLIKAVAKPFQKVFPAHTLLGKAMDPLGLTDPKRNLNLAGRVADVVGTAAAVVAGGWAIGAATAGTAGGFWATAGAGAKAVGGWALTAGKAVGSGLAAVGSGIGTAASSALPGIAALALARSTSGQTLTPQEQAALQYQGQYDAQGNPIGGGSSYGGGGGGGSYDAAGNFIPAPAASEIPIVPIALGLGLVLVLASANKKGK